VSFIDPNRGFDQPSRFRVFRSSLKLDVKPESPGSLRPWVIREHRFGYWERRGRFRERFLFRLRADLRRWRPLASVVAIGRLD
jgi:hypothetical protein